ncbi:hypothetical protein D3C72_752400 [compost metagenome]
MNAGDPRQTLPAGEQTARNGEVNHRENIQRHHQHNPGFTEQQIVQGNPGELLQIAVSLKHQHPRQRRDIGRR